MNYIRLGIFAVVALAFIGLGLYAWDADKALAKCVQARKDDIIAAQNKALEVAAKDRAKTEELQQKHSEEVKVLVKEGQSREDRILAAAKTTCPTPGLDAFLNSVWDNQRTRTDSTPKAVTPSQKK